MPLGCLPRGAERRLDAALRDLGCLIGLRCLALCFGNRGLQGFEEASEFFVAGQGDGEGLGTDEAGDGLGAEVEGTQGGELGVDVERGLIGSEGFHEAVVGDADQLNFGGEIAGGHLVEHAALVLLEGGGVEAVFPGVTVAAGGATFLGSHGQLAVDSWRLTEGKKKEKSREWRMGNRTRIPLM